jgi:hypothetical protein
LGEEEVKTLRRHIRWLQCKQNKSCVAKVLGAIICTTLATDPCPCNL